MTTLDPTRKTVREHLRYIDGELTVVLRQSKEFGKDSWTWEIGETRRRRGRGYPTMQEALAAARESKASASDYIELLRENASAFIGNEVTEQFFFLRQRTLWTEVRAHGVDFASEVYDAVRTVPRVDTGLALVPKTHGDLVKYWFNTGALGHSILYGQVMSAGSKQFTVKWESGVINRIDQNSRSVTFVFETEEVAEVRKLLERK